MEGWYERAIGITHQEGCNPESPAVANACLTCSSTCKGFYNAFVSKIPRSTHGNRYTARREPTEKMLVIGILMTTRDPDDYKRPGVIKSM